MKLLMRADVEGVGKKGDIAQARRWLRPQLSCVPKGFAIAATKGVAAQAAAMRKVACISVTPAIVRPPRRSPRSWSPQSSLLAARAGADGKLFGSVTVTEVIDASPPADQRRAGSASSLHFLDEPIKTVGTHSAQARSPHRCAVPDHRRGRIGLSSST